MGTDAGNSPVNQRTRILLVWVYGTLFLLSVLLIAPAFGGTSFGATALVAGIALVAVSVFGRCWASMHIGSRKNVELIQSGPYGHCRNPLYFCQILAALGFGLMSQSIVLTIAIGSAFLVTFLMKIKEEECYLSRKFGGEYEFYRRQVPRLVPRIRLNLTHARAGRSGFRHRLRQVLDTFAILLLIPVVLLVQGIRDFYRPEHWCLF